MNTDTAIRHFNQSLAVAQNSGEVFEAMPRTNPSYDTKPVEMNRWFEVVHGKNEKTRGVLT